MNTLQSNDSNESGTTSIEPTAAQLPQSAQNEANSVPSSDKRAEGTDQPYRQTSDEVAIALSVWQPKIGDSKANLTYWALESLKVTYLKTAEGCSSPGDEDYTECFVNAIRIQEIQNTLFDEVCSLASFQLVQLKACA